MWLILPSSRFYSEGKHVSCKISHIFCLILDHDIVTIFSIISTFSFNFKGVLSLTCCPTGDIVYSTGDIVYFKHYFVWLKIILCDICIFMWVHAYVHADEYLRLMSVIFLNYSLHFWDSISFNLEIIYLPRLAVQSPLGICLSMPLSTGIIDKLSPGIYLGVVNPSLCIRHCTEWTIFSTPQKYFLMLYLHYVQLPGYLYYFSLKIGKSQINGSSCHIKSFKMQVEIWELKF